MSIQDNLCLFGKNKEGQGWKIANETVSVSGLQNCPSSIHYTLCLCSGAIVLISDQSY